MDRFKAVREIYLPFSGLWVAEYPFLNRAAFMDLSYTIEQERLAGASRVP